MILPKKTEFSRSNGKVIDMHRSSFLNTEVDCIIRDSIFSANENLIKKIQAKPVPVPVPELKSEPDNFYKKALVKKQTIKQNKRVSNSMNRSFIAFERRHYKDNNASFIQAKDDSMDMNRSHYIRPEEVVSKEELSNLINIFEGNKKATSVIKRKTSARIFKKKTLRLSQDHNDTSLVDQKDDTKSWIDEAFESPRHKEFQPIIDIDDFNLSTRDRIASMRNSQLNISKDKSKENTSKIDIDEDDFIYDGRNRQIFSFYKKNDDMNKNEDKTLFIDKMSDSILHKYILNPEIISQTVNNFELNRIQNKPIIKSDNKRESKFLGFDLKIKERKNNVINVNQFINKSNDIQSNDAFNSRNKESDVSRNTPSILKNKTKTNDTYLKKDSLTDKSKTVRIQSLTQRDDLLSEYGTANFNINLNNQYRNLNTENYNERKLSINKETETEYNTNRIVNLTEYTQSGNKYTTKSQIKSINPSKSPITPHTDSKINKKELSNMVRFTNTGILRENEYKNTYSKLYQNKSINYTQKKPSHHRSISQTTDNQDKTKSSEKNKNTYHKRYLVNKNFIENFEEKEDKDLNDIDIRNKMLHKNINNQNTQFVVLQKQLPYSKYNLDVMPKGKAHDAKEVLYSNVADYQTLNQLINCVKRACNNTKTKQNRSNSPKKQTNKSMTDVPLNDFNLMDLLEEIKERSVRIQTHFKQKEDSMNDQINLLNENIKVYQEQEKHLKEEIEVWKNKLGFFIEDFRKKNMKNVDLQSKTTVKSNDASERMNIDQLRRELNEIKIESDPGDFIYKMKYNFDTEKKFSSKFDIPKLKSFALILREIGLNNSTFYDEISMHDLENDICETCFDSKEKLENHFCPDSKWNFKKAFEAYPQLKIFLDILAKKSRHENESRLKLEEKTLKILSNDIKSIDLLDRKVKRLESKSTNKLNRFNLSTSSVNRSCDYAKREEELDF